MYTDCWTCLDSEHLPVVSRQVCGVQLSNSPVVKMSCCPTGSLDRLGEQGYQPKGKVVRVGDLDIYVVGSGGKCVIWNYDIFGFNSGRTKELADLLAESGFLVVMPDYFRGTFQVTK